MLKPGSILSAVLVMGVVGCMSGDKVAATTEGAETPEVEEDVGTVSSAISGTCTTDLTVAKSRQKMAESFYHYISGNSAKAPTDTTLLNYAKLIAAELPYWTGSNKLCKPLTAGCGTRNPVDGQYYMVIPENNYNTTICSVPATMYRMKCVATATAALADCNKIYNNAGTRTAIQMFNDLAARAEALYPNIRPFMHDEPTLGYIEFDPPTAKLTSNLAGTPNGTTASAVLTTDNTTQVKVVQWPLSLTLCGTSTTPACPAVGQPCWAGALASGYTTNKQVAQDPSRSSYRKCY